MLLLVDVKMVSIFITRDADDGIHILILYLYLRVFARYISISGMSNL